MHVCIATRWDEGRPDTAGRDDVIVQPAACIVQQGKRVRPSCVVRGLRRTDIEPRSELNGRVLEAGIEWKDSPSTTRLDGVGPASDWLLYYFASQSKS